MLQHEGSVKTQQLLLQSNQKCGIRRRVLHKAGQEVGISKFAS